MAPLVWFAAGVKAYFIGATGYGLLGAAAAGYAAAGYAVSAVIAFGLSYAANALMAPDLSSSKTSGSDFDDPGILLNKASNNAPIKVVYGTRRVGGIRVFVEATGTTNEYLHLVIVLCEGEVSAINTVYLDGVISTDERFFNKSPMMSSSNTKWTLGTGWSVYGSRELLKTPGSASNVQHQNPVDVKVGYAYFVQYRVDNRVAGSITVSMGGQTDSARSADGTYEWTLTATTTDTLVVAADSSFDGKIGDVKNEVVYVREASVFIGKHTGASDQEADSNLVADVTNWTTAHRLRGVAYIYAQLKFDRDAFAGIPTITADVDGKLVYDTRDSQTKFSDSPSLCLRDYLTNTLYGRGIDSALIDDVSFEAAANYCETNVTLAQASVDRYTCNGVVDTGNTSMANIQKMLTCCRGWLVFSNGKYKLVIDQPTAKTYDFTEDNICGSWTISLGNTKNTFNRIRANVFNPDRDWQPDIAVVDSATLRTNNDKGRLLERTIDLPFTSDTTPALTIARAKMIATIDLKQSRQQICCEFTATIDALQVEVGTVAGTTHSTPGWSAKQFRVTSVSLQSNDETRIICVEYDPTVYDFGTISASDSAPDTNLPDPWTVPAPENLVATEETYVTRSGLGVKTKAVVTWTAGDIFSREYQVEYKLSADSTYVPYTKVSGLTAELLDLAVGNYDIRVKAFNSIGASSSYTSITQEFFGLSGAPGDITNLYMVIINNSCHFSWDKSVDIDVLIGGRVRIRHSPKLAGATWAGANDLGSAIPGNSTNAVLPLLSGTYLAKFEDSVNEESVNAVSVVTTIPNMQTFYSVSTVTEDPSYAGSKTNMSVVSTDLKFATMSPLTTGTYEFPSAGYIDMGAAFHSRLTAEVDFAVEITTDAVDSRTGNVDDWINWDTPTFVTDVQAQLFIATTDDDPAGSPSWSGWSRFTVGDYNNRAYKFKIEASSEDATHQILLSGLEVVIDMPDRVESDRNIATLTGGAKTVTFVNAFKSIPSVGVTVSNMSNGDYITVTNESTTGFDISVYNSAARVARNFNWLAQGYGLQI